MLGVLLQEHPVNPASHSVQRDSDSYIQGNGTDALAQSWLFIVANPRTIIVGCI